MCATGQWVELTVSITLIFNLQFRLNYFMNLVSYSIYLKYLYLPKHGSRGMK
jgi:hypothetical protein